MSEEMIETTVLVPVVHAQDANEVDFDEVTGVPFRSTPCGIRLPAEDSITMSDEWEAVTCTKCKRKKPRAK